MTAEENSRLRAELEAILFAAGYPMHRERLAELLGISELELALLALELAAVYNKSEHGIQLLMLEDTLQLCTKERHIEKIRDALGIKQGGNLSKSTMEALAIVAYHQPVTRSYIEQLRGMDSSYAVNNLLQKHLIEVCGRLDAPGHPALLKTTEDFLRVFGISSLEELPPTELFGVPELDDEKID